MGLNIITYRSFVSVVPLMKLRSYGRVFLLAIIVLGFSVGTARSYVFDVSMSTIDPEIVSRETISSFNEIIEMTESVDAAHKVKMRARFSKISTSIKSSSTAGNLCTSLISTQDTSSQKKPAVRTQRPVGKVAALGLLLGARFALAPPQQHNRAIIKEPDVLLECQVVNADDKVAPARSARAIAAYRQCQKNQALGRIASAR